MTNDGGVIWEEAETRWPSFSDEFLSPSQGEGGRQARGAGGVLTRKLEVGTTEWV